MSPRPTLRATSTSRFGSIVYDASPSTSDGAMPASSSAIEIAWHASESSVSGSPLPNVGLPDADDRGPVLDGRAQARGCPGHYQPFHSGARRSRNDATPSLRVLGRRVELDEHRLFLEEVRARELGRVVQQLLRPADRLGRARPRAARPTPSAVACSSAAGTTLLTMPSALGVGGREVVAEEDELLRLVHADDARQQVRDAAVGDEAAPHEHLDELGVVGRDHEVGREHEHRAAAGRGAVQRDDDRLLAVLDRLHQLLEAGAHHVDRAADHHRRARPRAGCRRGCGTERSAPVQKCRSPAAVSTMARTSRSQCASRNVLDQPVAHVVRDRVALVGAVDRQPQHAVLELATSSSSTFTPSGTGFTVHLLHHQCVEGDRAARPHDQRVDVELAHVAGEVEREALHLHDRVDERVDVDGLGAADAFEQLEALELGERAPRFVLGERRHAERHVAEHLDEDAAEPDRDDRAEQLVVETPMSVSTPPVTISHTITPSMRALPVGLLRLAQQLVVRGAHLLRRRHADLHDADVGLVQQVGRRDLHHDREADRLRRLHRVRGRRAQLVLRRLDAVRLQELLRVPLRERLARAAARRAACAPCFAAGSGVGRRVRERRAVARRERPVVGVALHGRDAVVERAEHRQAAVEQALVVRVVGSRRARPTPRRSASSVVFAPSMMSRVNGSLNVTTAPVIGIDEDVDVLVGEDHVEDLAAPRVGDRRAAAVDRVRDAQVRGDQPVVQRPATPW